MFPVRLARDLGGTPLLSYSWEFMLLSPPPILIPFMLAFPLRVRSAMFPGVEDRVYQTKFGPITLNHPGKKEFPGEVQMTFEDGTNHPIAPAFYLWHQMIFNEAAGDGWREEMIAASAWLRILLPDEKPFFIIHLHHVYPRRVVDVNLPYDSGKPIEFQVLLQYDNARMEWFPI